MVIRRLFLLLCLAAPGFAQKTPRNYLDLPIPGSDGKIIHLSQYPGKVLMIEMMLTECPECLNTMQFMGNLQREFGPRGFQAIGISLDPDPKAVKPYADRYRFPFPFGHLDKPRAIKFLDLKETAQPTVPYILFVNWQGSIRFQYPGDAPIFAAPEKNFKQIADGLLRQRAEKSGPKFQTGPAPGKH